MAICMNARVISKNGKMVEELTFANRPNAEAYKEGIESNTDNKVRLKKINC